MTDGIECAFTARIGIEPMLSTVASGVPRVAFLAVIDGGADEGQQWVRVAMFGARAAALHGRLKAGVRLRVEGTMTPRSWQAPAPVCS